MFDFAIVGGGIVGLSTGLALQRRRPDARILLLEKEKQWACHQTGRNSGVIHSGIYYKPGSLKATLAVEGNRRMGAFCREHGIPHEVCGKVIVATEPRELALLDALYQRGQENGLSLRKLDTAGLREIEPHAAGLTAIHVPTTGIVNYREVAEKMASLLSEAGADLRTDAEVRRIDVTEKQTRNPGVKIESSQGAF